MVRFRVKKKIGKIPVVKKKMFMTPLPKMKSPISQNVQVVKRKRLNVTFFPPSKEIANKTIGDPMP